MNFQLRITYPYSIRALAYAIENGNLDGADFKDNGTMGMLSLLKRYGVVPESAFSVKFREIDGKVTFTPRAPADKYERSKELGADELFHHELADNLRYFLATKGIDYLRSMSEPDLIQQMMYSRYGVNFANEPPQSFTYEGVNYTPQSFLHDFLQIDLDALVVKSVSVFPEVYTANNAISTDLNTFYADANANLHAGIAMPFGTSISMNRIFGGAFTTVASNRPYMEKMKGDLENKKKFMAEYEAHHTIPPADVTKPSTQIYLEIKDYVDHFELQGWNNDGGHAMLLVGPVKSTIQSAGDSDRLILKNSWGISIFGQEYPGALSSDGLFLIEQGYIKLSTQHNLIDYVTPKTPGVAPFLASANYQNQFVPGQDGSVSGGEIGSTYCDASGKCYPYCTNGTSTGGGFGWQPELGGPNGGSCRVPATDARVNGQSAAGQWCDGDGKCYPYCTNGTSTGGGFGWQPELGGPNGGSCRIR